jgi:hypothetical protein
VVYDSEYVVRAAIPQWRRAILREDFESNLRKAVDRAKQRAHWLNQSHERALQLIYDLGHPKHE